MYSSHFYEKIFASTDLFVILYNKLLKINIKMSKNERLYWWQRTHSDRQYFMTQCQIFCDEMTPPEDMIDNMNKIEKIIGNG